MLWKHNIVEREVAGKEKASNELSPTKEYSIVCRTI